MLQLIFSLINFHNNFHTLIARISRFVSKRYISTIKLIFPMLVVIPLDLLYVDKYEDLRISATQMRA